MNLEQIKEMHKDMVYQLLDNFCTETSPFGYVKTLLFLHSQWIGSEIEKGFDCGERRDTAFELNRTIEYLLEIHHKWRTFRSVEQQLEAKNKKSRPIGCTTKV